MENAHDESSIVPHVSMIVDRWYHKALHGFFCALTQCCQQTRCRKAWERYRFGSGGKHREEEPVVWWVRVSLLFLLLLLLLSIDTSSCIKSCHESVKRVSSFNEWHNGEDLLVEMFRISNWLTIKKDVYSLLELLTTSRCYNESDYNSKGIAWNAGSIFVLLS